MKMRSVVGAMCFALVLSASLAAQDKKAAGKNDGKPTTIQGTVQAIDQAKHSITIMVDKTARPIMFGADTKFLMGKSDNNKPGKATDIKANFFISCTGSADTKGDITAKECLYRESK